jgi:two-component system cell cycle response regulator
MDGRAISILVIDEKQEDALFYQHLLEKSPLLPYPPKTIHVRTLKSALTQLENRNFHLILTNLFLPDSQGIETFNQLHTKASNIPIVVLADQLDEKLGLKAIAGGAQDYLSKQELDIHVFARIVRFALERHQIHEALKELSFTDELTGIYNRRGFMTLAEQQIELSKRLKKGFFLFLIDLDNLKKINDRYGHKEGDLVLIKTAECLKKSFRISDVIGRIGGDEFAILALSSSPESKDLIVIALQKALAEYNAQKKLDYTLSLSWGITYFDPSQELTLEILLETADRELYEKKRQTHPYYS